MKRADRRWIKMMIETKMEKRGEKYRSNCDQVNDRYKLGWSMRENDVFQLVEQVIEGTEQPPEESDSE